MTMDGTMDEAPRSSAAAAVRTLGALIAPAVIAFGCIGSDSQCGDHQRRVRNACVCVAGYEMADDGMRCVQVSAPASGLGDACMDATACSPPFDFCAEGSDGGYCTSQDCAASADCEPDWYCAMAEAPSFCHEPPSGLGESCDSADDCADFEADFCESFNTQRCQVIGCTTASPCPNGYVCCDLTPTGFFEGTQCIKGGSCPIGELVP